MSFPHLQAAHTGASASAGMGTMNHLHTKQMGFQAAQRLQVAKALGGGGGAMPGSPAGGAVAPVNAIRPPMAPSAPVAPMAPQAPQAPQGGDWRQHAAQASGLPGVTAPEIHGAVGALAQAGQLNPIQAHALMTHQGPLQGQAGAQTVGKVAQAMKMLRARRQASQPHPMAAPGGMPSQGPVSQGGMPPGMGQ